MRFRARTEADEERRRHQEEERKDRKEQLRWQKVAAVAASIVAATAVVGFLVTRGSSTTSAADPSTSPSVVASSGDTPSPSPSPSPSQLGTKIPLGCPAPPGHNKKTRLVIRVPAWCAFPGVRGQSQFKLKVWVDNISHKPLDISLPHWYVIVDHLRLADWSPPTLGTQPARRPIRTRYKDQRVWAIPANPERAYDPMPNDPGMGTFATHWNGATIAPEETFRPPLADREHGILVFYIPFESVKGVEGVAYMDGEEIVALCPPDNWGKRLPAASF